MLFVSSLRWSAASSNGHEEVYFGFWCWMGIRGGKPYLVCLKIVKLNIFLPKNVEAKAGKFLPKLINFPDCYCYQMKIKWHAKAKYQNIC